jgi:type IV pilus assembly protein PilM
MSSVVALDLGSSAIAAVEITTTREKVSLTNANVEPIPTGLMHDGEIQEPDELADVIRRIWKAGGFSGRKVRLGIANQRVLVRVIDLPVLTDVKERRAAVAYEAQEHIPIPLDQAVMDFQGIGTFAADGGERERIVVVAAPRDMIDQLARVVRRARLQPTGIDLEAFAILRALMPPASVLDEGSPDTDAQVVVHVGAEVTHVIVSVDRNCHFTRLVNFGGDLLTAAVAQRLECSNDQAEALKITCGLLGDPQGRWDADTVAEVQHALALAARPLVREVVRSLDYYRSQPSSRTIDKVVLSGGTALCMGLDRYMRQGLSIPVETGDAASQLDDRGGMSTAMAHRASVAIGLAMDGGSVAR